MNNKPVILVVDDQPQNIELLEAYLVPEGYEIVKAANGEEALEKLSGNQIDLMLLDVMMPGMMVSKSPAGSGKTIKNGNFR
jgi:putative two-component system response regulator